MHVSHRLRFITGDCSLVELNWGTGVAPTCKTREVEMCSTSICWKNTGVDSVYDGHILDFGVCSHDKLFMDFFGMVF